jgi:hypothetical protein
VRFADQPNRLFSCGAIDDVHALKILRCNARLAAEHHEFDIGRVAVARGSPRG